MTLPATNIELVSFAVIDIVKLTEAAPANNDDNNNDNESIIIIIIIQFILYIASPIPSTVTFCIIVPCISALTYLLTVDVLMTTQDRRQPTTCLFFFGGGGKGIFLKCHFLRGQRLAGIPVPASIPDPTRYRRVGAGRVKFSTGTGIPGFTREI